MSYQSQQNLRTATVKEAYKNLSKWSAYAPTNNRFTHKQESKIMCASDTCPAGEVVCVQIGTPKQPVYCPFGLSRWSQRDGKFITVDDPTSTEWAYAAAGESSYQRKTPGGKLQAQLTLHEWDTPGTQGYYTYQFLTGLQEQIIKGLAHGLPDQAQIDPATGKPVIVQGVELVGAPNATPDEREKLFRFNLSGPIRESDGGYAPTVKTKVRYSIKPGDLVGLDIDLLDASKPIETDNKGNQIGVPYCDQFKLFKERCRGVFVIKINPLQFKKNEITMTIDIVKALIMPTQSLFKKVELRMDADDDAEMTEAGTNNDDDQQDGSDLAF